MEMLGVFIEMPSPTHTPVFATQVGTANMQQTYSFL